MVLKLLFMLKFGVITVHLERRGKIILVEPNWPKVLNGKAIFKCQYYNYNTLELQSSLFKSAL
jgi:hypothetical protein